MEIKDLITPQINELVNNKSFDGKNIVLYNQTTFSYEIIKMLGVLGYPIKHIMSTWGLESTSKWGVPISSVAFAAKNDLLLIGENYYAEDSAYLKTLGFGTDKNTIFFNDYTDETITEKKLLKNYKKGASIYGKLKRKFSPQTKFLLCFYPGTGDTYFISIMLKEYLNKTGISNYVAVSMNKSGCKLLNLAGIKNTLLPMHDSELLWKFALFTNQKNIINLNPSPSFTNSRIRNKFFWNKSNMLDMYKNKVFGLNLPAQLLINDRTAIQQKFFIDNDKSHRQNAENMLKTAGLKQNKTVILSPYANTIVGYPVHFWEKLARKLTALNFTVATNCGPNEPPIKGTVTINPDYDYINDVFDMSGCFVGLRSGLCDVVIKSKRCKKIILYPLDGSYDNFITDIYRYCSFERMDLSAPDIIEIQWDYKNLDILAEKVVQTINN